MTTKLCKKTMVWAALAGFAMGAIGQTQGVSKSEILVGTIVDLSGPVAAYGKQARSGMQLRIDEVNEQGGIHGRKLKLLAEDDGYDPKRSVLAAQKLVNQDKVFVVAGHIGTAHNNAVIPIQSAKNVMNFMPLAAARDMYEPADKLKWSMFPAYHDQIRTMLPKLVKDKNIKRVCTLYQDDDLGLEVLRGGEVALKALGMDYVEKTSYKRGATDFSSQVARMKAANCELVVLGTIIRETVGAMSESRRTGFAPVFLGHNGTYSELIPKLGGAAVDGLYAVMTQQIPYLDDTSQPVRFWATKYKTRFNEDPQMFSVYGYVILDALVRALDKAGPNLTSDGLAKTMEALTVPADVFGGPALSFGPTRHLGSDLARLSQLTDGRWRVVSDYAKR